MGHAAAGVLFAALFACTQASRARHVASLTRGFAGIAAQIPSPVKAEEGADLVIQYEVRLDKSHTCGGMYLKLLNGGTAPGKLDGDTPYTIMFGPDHCGGTNKVRAARRRRARSSGGMHSSMHRIMPTVL